MSGDWTWHAPDAELAARRGELLAEYDMVAIRDAHCDDNADLRDLGAYYDLLNIEDEMLSRTPIVCVCCGSEQSRSDEHRAVAQTLRWKP